MHNRAVRVNPSLKLIQMGIAGPTVADNVSAREDEALDHVLQSCPAPVRNLDHENFATLPLTTPEDPSLRDSPSAVVLPLVQHLCSKFKLA